MLQITVEIELEVIGFHFDFRNFIYKYCSYSFPVPDLSQILPTYLPSNFVISLYVSLSQKKPHKT